MCCAGLESAVPETRSTPLWAGRTLALLGILLVALNLRTAVAAVSPIVSQIDAEIPLSVLGLGIIGMLPPVCFAVFGILTPVLTRRVGLEVSAVSAIVVMIVGHLLRAVAGDYTLLLIGSVLAFAGMGIGNVLLPPLVKRYFPDRIGLLTSAYAACLAVSTFLPPLVAAPLTASTSWRVSLGIWAALAFIALVPWLGILFFNNRATDAGATIIEEPEELLLGRVWHSPIAWAIGVVFAMSSFNAYAMFAWLPELLSETAGLSAAASGSLLSLYAAMGLPAALLIPVIATRIRNAGLLVYVGVLCWIVGDLGLLLIPSTATWVWVAFAGAGPLLFPVALVLINLRTRSHEMAVALSGFVQGVGYTLGALGPLLFGLFHELTGGWLWSLVLLLASALMAAVAAIVLSRPTMIEDDVQRIARDRP